jgi:hypothetical protein
MTKLCECGCGRQTRLAKRTDSRSGLVAGQPVRFAERAHAQRRRDWRGQEHGYVVLYRPEHPNANKAGYVKEHVVVAAEAMGKPLPKGADVHHVSGDRSDNRNRNLVVCQDRAYHFLLHVRKKALDACGNPDWRACCLCHRYSPVEQLSMQRNSGKHPECARKAARERYWQKKTAEPAA